MIKIQSDMNKRLRQLQKKMQQAVKMDKGRRTKNMEIESERGTNRLRPIGTFK